MGFFGGFGFGVWGVHECMSVANAPPSIKWNGRRRPTRVWSCIREGAVVAGLSLGAKGRCAPFFPTHATDRQTSTLLYPFSGLSLRWPKTSTHSAAWPSAPCVSLGGECPAVSPVRVPATCSGVGSGIGFLPLAGASRVARPWGSCGQPQGPYGFGRGFACAAGLLCRFAGGCGSHIHGAPERSMGCPAVSPVRVPATCCGIGSGLSVCGIGLGFAGCQAMRKLRPASRAPHRASSRSQEAPQCAAYDVGGLRWASGRDQEDPRAHPAPRLWPPSDFQDGARQVS